MAQQKVELTEQEWQERLSPQQYEVLRKQGTERAFSGALVNEHADGVYRCAGCGQELFASDTKFDSGTGWPSFWQPLPGADISYIEDRTFGMRRTEVECGRCGGHLGHLFDDGPAPTGQRFCMNSVSLELDPS